MSHPNAPQSRRTFLKRSSATMAGTAVAGGLPALALGADAAFGATAANPIVDENRNTPSSTWSEGFRLSTPSTEVGGYTRRPSVNLGEDIELVACGPCQYLPPEGPAETTSVEVYRLGYYGGKGGRLVWSSNKKYSTWQLFDADGNPANSWDGGEAPPIQPQDSNTGLGGRAGWKTTLTVPGSAIPASGVYLIKMKNTWQEFPPGVAPVPRSGESHAIVIVRDDNRPRDILAVLPTNTWQAYNYWGGRSLYTYNSRYQSSGSIVPATSTERAAKVSLDRPYLNFLADYNWVLRTEFPWIWWAEQQGYDITYTDDVGLHFHPEQALPSSSKSVAILGHGEYWTTEIRDAIENGRDAGTNVYNFGANCGYWRVRYETVSGQPATSEADARVLVCYKVIEGGGSANLTTKGQADPGVAIATTTWRDPGKGSGIYPQGTGAATPNYRGPNRPESRLFGVQYIGDDDNGRHPLTVPADNGQGEFAGHSAWRYTNLPKNTASYVGDGTLGWEWDGIPPEDYFWGGLPATKNNVGLKRLTESDPRPTGQNSHVVYVLDAGRKYGPAGAGAEPPPNGTAFAHAVTYTAPSGAFVFSSGTIHWSWGLGPHYVDNYNQSYADPATDGSVQAIRQATANLFVDGGIKPATPTGVVIEGVTATPTPTKTPTPTATPRPTPTPTPTPAPGADTAAPEITGSILNSGLSLLGWTYISKTTRKLSIKVNCPTSEKSGPVRLVATLKDGVGQLGTVTGSVDPGKSTQLDLIVGTTEFKRITATTALSVTLVVVGTDAVGNAKTVTNTLKLRAN
ncbi:MAG: hypothetical protein PGN13_10275 [Patulibacter minatonensis]